MYNYYHNTAVTQSILANLPAFVNKDIKSNFYNLLNPYGVYSESFYLELISTVHELNPMTVDYGLPSTIFSIDLILETYYPFTPSYDLTEIFDLKEFNQIFPSSMEDSSIQDFGLITNPNQSSSTGAGENIADFHYVSPLHYLDDSDGLIKTLDEGFITVHEGIYISDNLINIYDKSFTHIKSFSLPTLEQKGSDLKDDEWIEQDDLNILDNGDYKYYPKHHCITTISKVLVPTEIDTNGLALVIDSSHYALSYEYDTLGEAITCVTFDPTLTDGGSNSWDITNTQLIIEYNYFPSKVLGGITFLADYHSILSSNKLNANPISFVSLPNTFYQFNGSGSPPSSYDNTTQYLWTDSENAFNVTIQQDETTYSTPTLSSKLTLNGHEAREGIPVKEQDIYDLELTETFIFTGAETSKTNTGIFEIQSLGVHTITVDSTDGTDEASDFRVDLNTDGNGDNDGIIITRSDSIDYGTCSGAETQMGVPDDPQPHTQAECEDVNLATPGTWTPGETHITLNAAIKAIQLDGLADGGSVATPVKYYTSYEETVSVVTPGATESFYLSYPVQAAPTVDQGSSVVWTDLEKLITIDTSSLTAEDKIVVSYSAYTKTYQKDSRKWFASMTTRSVDIPATYTNCEYLGRTTKVVKASTITKSLSWYKRFLHIEENTFLQSLLSLDMSDNTVHLYTINNELIDVKLLSPEGAELTIDSSSTNSDTYWQTTVEDMSAICLRVFENTMIVLYQDIWTLGDAIIRKGTGPYKFIAYNVDTLEPIWSKEFTIADYKISSFTIDKDHKIHMIGVKPSVDTKVFTYDFRYDYYYCFKTETGYKTFYFHNNYDDLVFKDDSDAIQLYHNALQEPQTTFTTPNIPDVTVSQDYILTLDEGDVASNVVITSVTSNVTGVLLEADYSLTDLTLTVAADAREETLSSQPNGQGTAPANAETVVAWTIDLNAVVGAGETVAGSEIYEVIIHNTSATIPPQGYIHSPDGTVTILATYATEGDDVRVYWNAHTLIDNGETLDIVWTVQSNDFSYTENIVEFSTDQFGRAIGSDRWFGEKGTDYLDRLTNITEAKGNVTREGAVDGISATYNATSYNLESTNMFSLSYPIQSGQASSTLVTLNGNYDYYNDSGNTGNLLTYNTHFTVLDASDTHAGVPVLTITNTNSEAVDGNGEIAVEVIYISNRIDSDSNNLVVTENFTYTLYTQPSNFDDIITIDDLTDDTFIESHTVVRDSTFESTGIYSKELIKYLKKGAANFKFKWNEFEWDRYEWADGTSIRRGLPTFFDGITCIPSATTNNADQKFNNGVGGKALRYLGKNEDGIPRISLGNFYYLDTEYSLYNTPTETIIDVTNYPSGTWSTANHTPLVYFDDADGDGTEDGTYDTPVYFQPGSAAPIIVDDVIANAAMTVAAGDNGLNTMEAASVTVTCTYNSAAGSLPASSGWAQDSDNNYIFEVYYPIAADSAGHIVLLPLTETTHYTMGQVVSSITSLLDPGDADLVAAFPGLSAPTHDLLIVYNSNSYVNSHLITDEKPENSIMRINRMNSINYADAGNDNRKTLGTDVSKLYEEYDFSELTNPYSDTSIDQIINHTDNDVPTSTTFRLRDPATGNIGADRPWLTNDWDDSTADLRVDDPDATYRFLCDTSYEKETTIPGDGPQLNSKFNNIGNTILVVGKNEGVVNTAEIFPSKKLVDETDSYHVFVKLLDTEHGRIAGKDIKILAVMDTGTISTNEAVGVTREDGIAIVPIEHIISGGNANAILTLTVSAIDDTENWSATAELIQTDT